MTLPFTRDYRGVCAIRLTAAYVPLFDAEKLSRQPRPLSPTLSELSAFADRKCEQEGSLSPLERT
jgi:hypothetical protein